MKKNALNFLSTCALGIDFLSFFKK